MVTEVSEIEKMQDEVQQYLGEIHDQDSSNDSISIEENDASGGLMIPIGGNQKYKHNSKAQFPNYTDNNAIYPFQFSIFLPETED